MASESFSLGGKTFTGHVIPIGPVNLVFALGEKGLVGCGAVDVLALDKFHIPAAKVRPVSTPSVSSIDELLTGEIVSVNQAGTGLGITIGMSGKDALLRVS
ncbi:MAG: DUF1805 domain-containing protein [Methanospirillum sp.]|uniref:YunC family protein n=1 Tax=Methanospirillum sp. TaxID=45200 RepID=UPI00236B6FEF|nr:YunC family protein [Methanospirillum sp.]MDD1727800.1 DUF1805 domain-containing protein [Methanospirillum sp.]